MEREKKNMKAKIKRKKTTKEEEKRGKGEWKNR